MLECLILGDSIAVGTKMVAPTHCVSYAHSGWNSKHWNDVYLHTKQLDANTVVISLGSNDIRYLNSEKELNKLRKQIQAKRVVWIVPAIKPAKQAIVKKIASQYGDSTVTIKSLSKDGVHPTFTGYRRIVKDSGL
jgi:lysophospholipase L1-like esterase